MTTPRMYVACLASYNNGRLHGRWIDLDGASLDDVQDEIAAMLRESPYPNVTVECPTCANALKRSYPQETADKCPTCKGAGKIPSAEEWAVHDSEDLPAGFRDTEWPDLAKLVERLQELEDLSDEERDAFDAFAEVEDEPSVETFRERFIGEFNSWADMAEDYVDSSGLLHEVPERLRYYFDYEKYGNELRIGGDAYEHNGYYFWSH